MANLFDYISWRGDLTFSQNSFGEVDGLILSAVSYLPFECAESISHLPCSLSQVISELANVKGIEKKLLFKNDLPLINIVTESKRFASIQIMDYTSVINDETQFCALTLRLRPGHYAIVFRGTDNSIAGWKENFNMAYATPVPAQTAAAEYTERIISSTRGRYILCGHSKGGNLATYAAAFSGEESKCNIGRVYSYDSPGFDDKILVSAEYESIAKRIRAYIPQSSVVGIMFERDDRVRVIKSTRMGLLQHDIYSWEVMGNHLIQMEDTTKGSKVADKAFRDWLSQMEYEKREKFIDALFAIIDKTGAKTINDLSDNLIKSTRIMKKTFDNLDDETRDAVVSSFKLLAEAIKKSAVGVK